MPGIDDRIADLEKRLKQAKALKQQQVTRERAAEKKRQRSDDTRRKILVGAVILARSNGVERLHGDRALFGLLPVPSEAGTQTEPSVEWPKERLRETVDGVAQGADPRRRPGAVRHCCPLGDALRHPSHRTGSSRWVPPGQALFLINLDGKVVHFFPFGEVTPLLLGSIGRFRVLALPWEMP
jgi:hypothetical protein